MRKIEDYIRVTKVLERPSGIKQIPAHILKNAAERGEKVHEICTAIMEDMGIFPFDNQFEGYIKSFNNWAMDKKFIERPDRFYCDKYMITGEIDGIYQDKDELVLIDLKTSAKESKTWVLQASAYAYLCRLDGVKISRIEFVQLSKNGEDAVIYKYKENFEMFLKCLDIYKYFQTKENDEDYLQYI